MSKELQALEEIQNYKIKFDANIKYENGDETQHRFETIKDMFQKQFAIIETALKRIPELERENFELSEQVGMYATYKCEDEKKLKALEIIKEKEVDVFIFLHSGYLETYNDMVEDNRKLTQEEYDLLKEVLL